MNINIKKISAGFVSFAIVLAGAAILTANAVKAATVAPQIYRDLGFGLYGVDVQSLQQFLNGNGYLVASYGAGSPGQETYYFGNATRAALMRFQAAHGLAATGMVDSATRTSFGTLQTGITGITGYTGSTGVYYGSSYEAMLAQIEALKQRIAALQQELEAMLSGSGSGNPYIKSIEVSDGGDSNRIDVGDSIAITFSEAIDPNSINSDLEEGGYVAGIRSSETGGVSVASNGLLTIRNIAKFDVGTVDNTESYTVKLALSSSGKILTVALTGGIDVDIVSEDFNNASQIGGTIKDLAGNSMEADSNIDEPTGTFGGDNDNNDNDSDPYIVSIKVNDGGDEGHIDVGDSVKITFNEVIDPESINDDLDKGGYVTNISSSETGGFSVSSSGRVTINNIAAFDIGTVTTSGTFSSKVALDSSGKVLTVTLTSGGDFKITNEDFGNASQIGGTVEDLSGNKMENDSHIDDPTGTFGGDSGDRPYITSIEVSDGGDDDYVDVGDTIKITFNEAIDPHSINASLAAGGYVTGVSSYQIGGVSVTSAGVASIQGIAMFDIGSVSTSGIFTSRVYLSSNVKTLTVTLTDGIDVKITNEDFANASQVGGAVKDQNGNAMEGDSNIDEPNGTFGGDNTNDDENPYITFIDISNGGDEDYIDTGDTIKINFNESIDPHSIDSDLEEGGYVTGVGSSETGGVSVSSSGVVTVRDIVTFDVGEVEDSENYTSKVALNSAGDILTITLTSGSDIEITDENFNSTSQIGGAIEDQNGNEMEDSSNIVDPDGDF